MLLHDARREARVGPAGDLVLLDDQDRGHWDAARIAEGRALVRGGADASGDPARTSSRPRSRPSTTRRRPPADTDWPQIATLYGALQRMTPSPVVELNLAAAVAMADGPAVGLAMMDGIAADRRARDVSVPALGARRPAAPARALVGGGRRLPPRPGADDERPERAFLERRRARGAAAGARRRLSRAGAAAAVRAMPPGLHSRRCAPARSCLGWSGLAPTAGPTCPTTSSRGSC